MKENHIKIYYLTVTREKAELNKSGYIVVIRLIKTYI